ncbi:MAG: hypothetical protein GY948_12645 [Alphaproteobacteria bacterium]|nr:hypothetical protein [Alphaproteobacteria bacterium]
MADNTTEVQSYDDHKATYDGFISGCIAVALGTFFILVALVICGLANTHYITNLVVGVGGMFLGMAIIAVEAKAGSNYLTSLICWIVFALIAVFMVT